jgi:hypothetical protein
MKAVRAPSLITITYVSVLVGIVLFTIQSQVMLDALTSSSYTSPEDKIGTHYHLTLYSPNNQSIYSDELPLNFSLEWGYEGIPIGDYQLQFKYTYSIDDNPDQFNIIPKQSVTDHYVGGTNITTNPKFTCLINISNLTDGYHKIIIKADFVYAWYYSASYPVYFFVQNLTKTPTPAVPELPGLTIMPLLVILIFICIKTRKCCQNAG